jgi:formylglycine-generating enzyme required for sulfatase activity
MTARPHSTLLLNVAVVVVLASNAGCNWLWALDGPYDPLRCEPECPAGQHCYEGQCVGSGDGTVPTDSGQPPSDGVKPPSDTLKLPDAPPWDLGYSPNDAAVPGVWLGVNPGSFDMGSPTDEPCRDLDEFIHTVTLTRGFELMAHEVTQDEFHSQMGYNLSFALTCGASCPVENVSWSEAAAFCNSLSALKGLPECYTCVGGKQMLACVEADAYAFEKVYDCPGYRLPTDAEWEYAYRAGTSTAFYNGPITSCLDVDPNAAKIGWYDKNSGGASHVVGQKAANAWGFFDMAGNVSEWVHDWWHKDLAYLPGTDPWGAKTGTNRVVRGGSYGNPAKYLRAAQRNQYAPTTRYGNIGFRCARTTTP